MATKTIHLTIPTPCQQHWQDMKADGTGRFCSHCQKTVVDFSNLTDSQLITLLAQQNGSTCGRFQVGQLNRALPVTTPAFHSPGRFFSLLAAGLLGYQTVQAYALPMRADPPEQHVTENQPVRSRPPVDDKIPSTDSTRIITGRVVEQTTNVGIPGAGVFIKGKSTSANTDAEGRFQLSIPAEITDEPITLGVASIGYAAYEMQLPSGQTNPMLISLREDLAQLGEVIVVGTYRKPSFWQRLRNRLRATH